MLGRKSNLKLLTSKLWEVGATVVKTTEFVQGQTCRWGLAWSFLPPAKKIVSSHVAEKNNLSFMLEVWMLSLFFVLFKNSLALSMPEMHL
jgi:23S rRNA (adenine1618-N6)-methyltransferase